MSGLPSALAGRTAVITGASGDIGSAIAVVLGRQGARLCLLGRDSERLRATRAASGAEASEHLVDIAESDRNAAVAAEVLAEVGEVDLLVHSAGRYARGEPVNAPPTKLDELYRANVRGPYELTRTPLPSLVKPQGEVVVVGSTQGLSAGAGVGQFATTAHATTAIADSLRAEVNPAGVRVTTLHVGRTDGRRQEGVYAAEGRSYPPRWLIEQADEAALVLCAVIMPKRARPARATIFTTERP